MSSAAAAIGPSWLHGPCSAAVVVAVAVNRNNNRRVCQAFPSVCTSYPRDKYYRGRHKEKEPCCFVRTTTTTTTTTSRRLPEHRLAPSLSKDSLSSSESLARPRSCVLSMANHGQGETDSLDQSKRKPVVPVYVMMPLDTISINEPGGIRIKRLKALSVSLRALKLAGVQGVVVDVWWGIVERFHPVKYDWSVYEDLFKLVNIAGLSLHVVLSCHASLHSLKGSRSKISLPLWICEIGNSNKDIYYRDRHGFVSEECLSVGVDQIAIFSGRTALECYEDFMYNFMEKFKSLIGGTIREITVGLGPSGELRYPAHPVSDGRWKFPGVGEFQCYDKYMMEDLKRSAFQAGRPDWGISGPADAGSYNSLPFEEPFFKDGYGTFLSDYGQFFLGWYSGKLIEHADRVLSKAAQALNKCCPNQTGSAKLIAKVAGIHWYYGTESHAAELTAGYYNTAYRDGYRPIATVCARYGVALNVPCLEMLDIDQKQMSFSSPEGLVEQIREVAKQENVPLTGENSMERFDSVGFSQILRNAYCYPEPMRAFTFFRMRETLFRPDNWRSFVTFVKQMYIKSRDGGCNGKMYSKLCNTG